MEAERIAHLRAQVEAECLSWGEVAEIQSAFEEIDPATLPEPAENAGWGDMLDELEARMETRYLVPDMTLNVAGEATQQTSYPRDASYEVRFHVGTDGEVEVYCSSDTPMRFTEDEMREAKAVLGEGNKGTRVHGLGWVVQWDIGDGMDFIDLATYGDEIVSWLGYALGEQVWDYEEQGEEWE